MDNQIGTLVPVGTPVGVDLDKLIGSHLAIVANAGGGKSGAIRMLLEATHGKIQQIVLDVEDEYYTLREKFDYLVAGGDGGDCPATVAGAGALALMLLTHNISAVIQLNDLHAYQQELFIKAFLEAMLGAPRDLWHPVLTVIDEAHRFAPQEGRAESSEAVRDLTARGRKRGFTAVLATQRMAKIDKNVTGDVNNWLLGRVGQSTDRRTAADALGFSPTGAEARNMQGLATRVFWAFGVALTPEPVQIMIDQVQTTMPKPGQAKVATMPAPEALRKILATLPQEPVEAKTTDGAAKAGEAPTASPGVDTAAIRQEAFDAGKRSGIAEGIDKGLAIALKVFKPAVTKVIERIEAQIYDATTLVDPEVADVEECEARVESPPTPIVTLKGPAAVKSGETFIVTGKRSSAVQKIIETLNDFWPRAVPFLVAAKEAGVGLKSSQFRHYEPELRSCPEVEQLDDGRWRAKRDKPTGKDMLGKYQGMMMPSWWAMFSVIRDVNVPIGKDDIVNIAGISPTSSTGSAALRGLVDDYEIVEKTPDGLYQVAEAFR